MHIAVIGAGIVGLATAWRLRQDGHRVTVLDKHPEVGMGASHANGGQLSYRYIAPLADPDVLAKIPGWMLRRDAPVRFRPRFDPEQWRWIAAFLKACNGHDKLRSVASLLPLSLYSRALVHELVHEHGLRFDHARNGKLIVHRDRRDFDSARRLLDTKPELRDEQRALDADACLALEPALARLRGDLVGGIHTPGEEAGDCFKLCQALADDLRRGPNPAEFLLGQDALVVTRVGRRIVAVHTLDQAVAADAFVLATGVGTNRLLKPLGARAPLYPVKGYSVSLRVEQGACAPAVSVTDYQRKIVYAPIGDALRVAGMADIVGEDASLNGDRVATLIRETSALFGDWAEHAQVTPWAGLRPATPTGRPLVDRCPEFDNLWLNVGQGALGFTLAMGCAALIADRIGGRAPAVPDEAFRFESVAPQGWRPHVANPSAV